MKTQMKILILTISIVLTLYYIITFDYIEFKRNRIVNAQTEKAETLSGKILEVKNDLNSLQKELIKATKCIELNSNTGSVVDCATLTIHSIGVIDKELILDTIKTTENIEDKELIINTIGTKEDNYFIKLDKIICEVGQINGNKSPLCGNIELVKKLKSISDKKGVDFQLLLGITYAESHLGANYAKGCDSSFHNLGGIKWRIKDDGSKVKDQGLPTAEGCYLYKFNSIEDYWTSFSNSIKYGYINKGCSEIECISKWYVKGDGLYKPEYNNRVNVFKF